MSKIFDALKKAKNDQVDKLFSPTSKGSTARVPKYFVSKPNQTKDDARDEINKIEATSNNAHETVQPAIDSVPTNQPTAQTPIASSPVIITETANQPVTSKPVNSTPPPPQLKMVQSTGHPLVPIRPDRGNLVVLKDEPSAANEQFATLRAKLIVMARKNNMQTFCVTSSVMNEGKTFVSTNLALSLASESEKGVVIVDCDLRKPSVHRSFGIKDVTGLSDFLQSERTNIDSIIIDTDRRLSVIPAGRIPKNPLPLIDSDKMKWLIGESKQRYDFVVIDCPPTAPLADSDILASLSDGLIFVIRAGQTPLTVIQRSLKMLNKHRILGTVLNGTQEVPHYGYGYGYYSQGSKGTKQ